MIRGLDMSSVQGKIDVDKLLEASPEIQFVYYRCGVGNDGHDVDFAANAAATAARGLAVGAYHFLYPLPCPPEHWTRDPRLQAQAHAKASGRWGSMQGQLPPAMDLEWPAPQDWAKWGCTAESIKASAVAYLEECQTLHDRTPLIYSYPDFDRHLGDTTCLAPYLRWKAAYGYRPAGDFAIWQDSGGGGKLYNDAPVDTDVILDDVTFNRLANRVSSESAPNLQTP